MMCAKRHKHADLIHAWAEGAEIECKTMGGHWVKAIQKWNDDVEYRIKPEKKPDVVRYVSVDLVSGCTMRYNRPEHATAAELKRGLIKISISGDTGELLTAEALT